MRRSRGAMGFRRKGCLVSRTRWAATFAESISSAMRSERKSPESKRMRSKNGGSRRSERTARYSRARRSSAPRSSNSSLSGPSKITTISGRSNSSGLSVDGDAARAAAAEDAPSRRQKRGFLAVNIVSYVAVAFGISITRFRRGCGKRFNFNCVSDVQSCGRNNGVEPILQFGENGFAVENSFARRAFTANGRMRLVHGVQILVAPSRFVAQCST